MIRAKRTMSNRRRNGRLLREISSSLYLFELSVCVCMQVSPVIGEVELAADVLIVSRSVALDNLSIIIYSLLTVAFFVYFLIQTHVHYASHVPPSLYSHGSRGKELLLSGSSDMFSDVIDIRAIKTSLLYKGLCERFASNLARLECKRLTLTRRIAFRCQTSYGCILHM